MSEYGNKYPWLRLMNLYTGKVYKKRDAMDDMPDGWKLAFGDMLCDELDAAIKKAGVEDSFIFGQVKEKFGLLKMHHNQPRNSEIGIIIRKYETLSRYICIRCGKPQVPIVFAPWIRPMDEECYKKTEHCDCDDYAEMTKGSPSEMPRMMVWEEYTHTDPKTKQHIYKEYKVDISDTVDKILAHWEERVSNGTNVVECSLYDKTYTPEEVFEHLRLKMKEVEEE